MKKRCLLVSSIMLLFLSACGSPVQQPAQPLPEQQVPPANIQPVPADFISGIVWQWGALAETASGTQSFVPEKEKYTILFQLDGIYTITADCNLSSGKYAIEGDRITILPGDIPLKECGDGSLYSNFLNLLGNVTRFGIQDDQLVLIAGESGAQMFFYNGGKPVEQAEVPTFSAGIDVKSVVLDLKGLPYVIQPTLVEAGGYNNAFPTGPQGLPEHVEILFGVSNPADVRPSDPILYIIPVEAYQKLWDANGDMAVIGTFAKLESLLQEKPEIPPQGLPVLPFERAIGVNDLAVQGAYLSTLNSQGLRFVGRFVHDGSEDSYFYIYQGLTTDGKYLVAFFYPVSGPNSPQPDPVLLDSVIQSLRFSAQ